MENRLKLNAIINEFKASGLPIRWPISEALQSSQAVVYRNRVAKETSKKSVPEIVESYAYLSPIEMEQILTKTTKYLLSEPFKGIGIELGAGCSLLASVVAKQAGVEAVLAVEICDQVASLIPIKVASWVLGGDAEKIVPVSGSFDELHLPNDSIDFAIEIDSFHHSDNLKQTLSECARVLRPGGTVVCFDRCHPNSVTDAEVEEMLSGVYPREVLIEMGYPPDTVLTRRQNGEHEYRMHEWEKAFEEAGLKLIKKSKFYTKLAFKLFLKGILSVLPRPLRRLFYTTDDATLETSLLWIAQLFGLPVPSDEWGTLLVSPKETTVFILKKI